MSHRTHASPHPDLWQPSGLDEVSRRWLDTCRARNYAPATLARFISTLRQAVDMVGPLDQATDQQWRDWFEARSRQVSAESLCGELSTIRCALRWSGHATPRLVAPRRPQRLPRPLPAHDVAAVLTRCPEPVRGMALLMVGCGLRCAEVAELQVEDLDLTARRLTVVGKGRKERTVPIPVPVAEQLRHGHWPRSGAAFRRTDTGGAYSAYLVSAHVSRRMKEAGVKGTPHQLRHTYATALAEEGVDVLSIMARLGHSSPAMSVRYTRLTVRATEVEERAIARLLKPSTGVRATPRRLRRSGDG